MVYKPRFSVSPQLLALLDSVNHLHALIQQASIQVAWIPVLRKEALAREAHSSTAIEGNPLSLENVKTILEGKPLATASHRAVHEIENTLAVMRYMEKHAEALLIETRDIFKIHALLAKNQSLDRGPFGVYRTYGVQVGHHVAPHYKDVPKLMNDLLNWLNFEGAQWPAIMSSAILHYRFENIHPFGDGNGRVGRALAIWELYRRKFDTRHIFAVDEIYWENRPAYYAALRRVETDIQQDLTSWLEFVASALQQALERTWSRIQSLQAGPSRKALALTPNQERLVTLLRDQPMGIAAIQKALGVTKPGAHHILKSLLKARWIKRIGGHKTGVYKIK